MADRRRAEDAVHRRRGAVVMTETIMSLLASAVLVACGGSTPPQPLRGASPEEEEDPPHPDPDDACGLLRPESSNPVLGELPRGVVPLQGTALDGTRVDLGPLYGKVVLASFQASFDTLTAKEQPTFNALADAVGDRVAAADFENPSCPHPFETPPPELARRSKPPSTRPDPTQTIRGTLRFPATAKAGTAVFVVARRVHKGKPAGVPLAVTKLTYAGADLPFVLDNTMALSGDVPMKGTVLLIARYDLDADAISKGAGDLTGQLRVRVPARKVTLVVDQPVVP